MKAITVTVKRFADGHESYFCCKDKKSAKDYANFYKRKNKSNNKGFDVKIEYHK